MIMTETQINYFNHAISDTVIQDKIRRDGIRSIRDYPVCARCEKIAMHHEIGVLCHACGHFEPGAAVKFKDRLYEMR